MRQVAPHGLPAVAAEFVGSGVAAGEGVHGVPRLSPKRGDPLPEIAAADDEVGCGEGCGHGGSLGRCRAGAKCRRLVDSNRHLAIRPGILGGLETGRQWRMPSWFW